MGLVVTHEKRAVGHLGERRALAATHGLEMHAARLAVLRAAQGLPY